MRIGLLTTSFPRFEGDVAGQFVLGFARALAARGHELDVLAPEPAEALPEPSWPGIRVHFVRYLRPRAAERTFYGAGVPDNLRRDPLAWLGLAPFCAALYRAARVRRAGWDALVSHWGLPSGLIAGALCERRPHLAVFHSADLHLLSRLPLRTAFANELARSADRLLFVSHVERARFLGWLSDPALTSVRCMVQPMGIDRVNDPACDRDAERARFGIRGRRSLLTLARLVPVKGLCEAVRELRARRELTWVIAGDGPERARLAAFANEAELDLRLLGTVRGADKRALLSAADAFVLPSRILRSGRSEGVPTVLLEAMAAGLPVIAASVGGIPELVRDGETGLLFDPARPGALTRSVERLFEEPGLACAIAERARALASSHEWSVIAGELERALTRA